MKIVALFSSLLFLNVALVRAQNSTNVISTITGHVGVAGSVDNVGTNAQFNTPHDVAVDAAGNVYVADQGNHTIRELTLVGTNWVSATIAGKAGVAGSADGTGTNALFNNPSGVALDANGNVYVADEGNQTIRELTPVVGLSWRTMTIAGLAGNAGSADGTNGAARFNSPSGLAVDGNGNVYVADWGSHTIREMISSGTNWAVSTITGLAGKKGTVDGANGAARFNHPADVAVDGSNNVYVADWGNHAIREMTLAGTNWNVVTIAGVAGSTNYGSADGIGGAARFYYPSGLAVDRAGDVYVADTFNDTIRELTQAGGNWTVSTIAGLAGVVGSANGIGSNARFYNPCGVAVDSSNNVFVADTGNQTIRLLGPQTAISPVITAQPQSVTATNGNTISFNVAASGSTPFYFQWLRDGIVFTDGGNLFGSATSNLTITNVSAANAGVYSVVVSNAFGSVTSSIAALNFFVALPPGASGLTFDDISDTGGGTILPSGYAGLKWNNFYYLNALTYGSNPSGYRAGLVSPSNTVYNYYGYPAYISNSVPFNFYSGYLTAAWNDNLQVQVLGYNGATLTYSNVYALSATAPTLINFNYLGITEIYFNSYGGTPHPGYSGSGTQFSMDSVVVSAVYSTIEGPILNSANGHNYYIVSKGSWTNAQAAARALGGNLATIRSAAENNWIVTNLLVDFSHSGGPNLSVLPLWIGLYDPSQDLNGGSHATNFVWADGEPVTYTDWHSGEPSDSGGNEFYGAINWFFAETASSDPGKWNDTPLNGTTGYGGTSDGPYYGIVEVAGSGAASNSIVVNIDATVSGISSGGSPGGSLYAPVQVPVAAGTYQVTIVNSNLNPNARFLAWNFNPNAQPSWVENFYVFDDAIAKYNTTNQQTLGSTANPLLAFYSSASVYDATNAFNLESNAAVTITVTNNTTLDFVITDYGLYDNLGGVSVMLTPISPAALPAISGPSVYGNLIAATPNLLGYWPFSTASQANSSVNGYTGTFVGNAAIGPAGSGPALVNGMNNTALVLDGTNSYVNTSLVGGLSTTGTNANQGSIIAWFKLAALPSNLGHFFSIAGESQTGNDFDLQIETDNKLKFYTDSGSATVDTAAFTTNDLGVWHFVAATFTGGSSRNLYLDGQLVASSTPGSHNAATGGTFAMGYSDVFAGRYFGGSLDEVAVFNRQLTGSEVTNLYAAAVQPSFSSPAQNVTVNSGSPFSFTITASGYAPLFYQWQKNGTNLADGGNISGSRTNTLNLSTTSTGDDGSYAVIVTNIYGSVTSSVVTMTVIAVTNNPGATITWTNSNGGSWNNAANWSPHQVPGALDTAIANQGIAITIDSPAAVSNFTFNGTLGGSKTLTVNGTMNWTGGDLEGSLTVAQGGTLAISNHLYFAYNNYYYNYTNTPVLTNYGTVVCPGIIYSWGNSSANPGTALVDNAGLWQSVGDNSISTYAGNPASIFINTGTLQKTGGTGTSTIGWNFTSSGTINTPTGTFTLNWNGASTLNGNLSLASGTVITSLTVASNAVLNLAGGDLEGSLTVAQGGMLAISNYLYFAENNYNYGYTNTATLTNYGTVVWSGTIYGWGNSTTRPGNVEIYNAGLWQSAADNSIGIYTGNPTNVFVNTGTLQKTGGAATSTISWNFNNNGGTVSTPSGSFSMLNWTGNGSIVGNANFSGGTLSGIIASNAVMTWMSGDLEGSLTVAQGGTLAISNYLYFAYNNYYSGFTNAAALTNYGTVVWSGSIYGWGNNTANPGSGIIYNAGLWQSAGDSSMTTYAGNPTNFFINTGTLQKTGGTGTSTIGWSFASTGTINTPTGTFTLNWNGASTLHGNLSLASGTVITSLTIASNAMLNLSGGDLEGALTVAQGGMLTISNTVYFAYNNYAYGYTNTAALTNYGTVVWAGTIYGSGNSTANPGGGIIYNAGLWQSAVDNSMTTYGGNPANVFINTGTLQKTGGTGTTTVNWNFNNNGGTVGTPSGAFQMANWTGNGSVVGNANFSGGTISGTVAAGAVMNFSGATIKGSMTVSSNAVANWNGGDLEGPLTVAQGGMLTISNTVYFAYNNYAYGYTNTAALTNYGTVVWAGTIYGSGNSTANPGGGIIYNAGLWQSAVDNSMTTYGGNPANVFINTGTLQKTGGTGTTTVNWNFNNNGGTVGIRSGVISVNNGFNFSRSSTLDIAIGGTNQGTGFGQLQVNGSVVLDGTLNVTFANGFTPAVPNTFSFLTARSVSGSFASFFYPSNVAGLQLSGTAASAVLTAVNLNGGTTLTWVSGAVGNWSTATNWFPNQVPGPTDTAIINNGTATVSADTTVGTLNLSNGAIVSGTATLTISNALNWSSGARMVGGGRTVIATNATATVDTTVNYVVLDGWTLENAGTMLWIGGNTFYLQDGSVLTNRSGALIAMQNDATIETGSGAAGRVDNAGTFRKTVSTGTTTVYGAAFNNYGAVDWQSGTLTLASGGTDTGSLTLTNGTTLNLSGGTDNFSAASSVTGPGNLVVSGATANFAGLVNAGTNTFSGGVANITGNYVGTNVVLNITGGTANFNGQNAVTPAVLNLNNNGVLGGTNLVSVGTFLNWSSGARMVGGGRTVIATNATATVDTTVNYVVLDGWTLENAGTMLWIGGNTFYLQDGSVLTNRSGALIAMQNDATIGTSSGAAGRVDNAGTFRKTVSTGTTTVYGAAFNNYGAVDLQSGILSASSGFNFGGSSALDISIGGTSPGTGFGQLQVSGSVALAGTLNVVLTNSFHPALTNTFTILSAGSLTGNYASFIYPSNSVGISLTNTATSSILIVTNLTTGNFAVAPVPVLSPQLSGGSFNLSFQSVSGQSYTLYYNDNLGTTNWLPYTNVTGNGGTLQLTVPTTNSAQRFFRVSKP